MKLQLNKNGISRYEQNPFPFGTLEIEICNFPNYQNTEYRFVCNLDGVEIIKPMSVNALNSTVIIPSEKLKAGILWAELQVWCSSQKVETYEIEPLKIEYCNGEFKSQKVIEAMQGTIEEQGKQIASLTDTVNALIEFCNNNFKKIPYTQGAEFKGAKKDV